MRWLAALACGIAASAMQGCAPGGGGAPRAFAPRPEAPDFAAAIPAGHTAWSNASLAEAFTELTHGLEWGAQRPGLVRYEAPIRVAIEGPGADGHAPFLDALLAMIRRESDVDIRRVADGASAQTTGANLHIRLVAGERFRQLLPSVACIVAPGDIAWTAFARDPDKAGGAALERARSVEAMTIFIPQDAAPHRIRSCLIEEVLQALGPANDLFGLGASIFNDDGAHLWPTRLDFLMLRVLYQPEIRTGLSRSRTRDEARTLLRQLNPAGEATPPLPRLVPRGMLQWRRADRAVFRDRDPARIRERARKARDLARRAAPGSAQHCHALAKLGRIEAGRWAVSALETLADARKHCAATHGQDDIRLALIALDESGPLLATGRYDEALLRLDRAEPVLVRHGREERLAALHAIRTRALRARAADAEGVGEADRAEALTASIASERRARAWAAHALGTGGAETEGETP